MATAQQTDRITRVVDLYIEGCRDGDGAKLERRSTRTRACGEAWEASDSTSRSAS